MKNLAFFMALLSTCLLDVAKFLFVVKLDAHVAVDVETRVDQASVDELQLLGGDNTFAVPGQFGLAEPDFEVAKRIPFEKGVQNQIGSVPRFR